MGCDGGTIPTRGELVKTKKKKAKLERQVENSAKWKHCAVSQQPLRTPIVASRLGKLYNKDALIEALLKQKKTGVPAEGMECVQTLKDVKEVKLAKNPGFKPTQGEDGKYDSNAAEYICPIAGVEMNGIHRFILLWSCCCVLSEKALKEIASLACPNCGKEFSSDDKIVLYGTAEEMEAYRQKYEEVVAAKNSRKKKTDEPGCSGTSEAAAAKVRKVQSSNGSEDQSVGFVGEVKALTKTSIQKDPKASKTFKSLFTTCAEAKNRPLGHWVTYNPLYN